MLGVQQACPAGVGTTGDSELILKVPPPEKEGKRPTLQPPTPREARKYTLQAWLASDVERVCVCVCGEDWI